MTNDLLMKFLGTGIFVTEGTEIPNLLKSSGRRIKFSFGKDAEGSKSERREAKDKVSRGMKRIFDMFSDDLSREVLLCRNDISV